MIRDTVVVVVVVVVVVLLLSASREGARWFSMARVFPPGAAVMSRMVSSGWGSRARTGKIEAKSRQ